MNKEEINLRNGAIAHMLGWKKVKLSYPEWVVNSTKTHYKYSDEYWVEEKSGILQYHSAELEFHKNDLLLESASKFIVDFHNAEVIRCLFPGGWEVNVRRSEDFAQAVHFNKTGEPLVYLPSSSPREALFLALSDFSMKFLPTSIELILEQISVQDVIAIHSSNFTAAIDSKCQDAGLEVWYEEGFVIINRRIK